MIGSADLVFIPVLILDVHAQELCEGGALRDVVAHQMFRPREVRMLAGVDDILRIQAPKHQELLPGRHAQPGAANRIRAEHLHHRL